MVVLLCCLAWSPASAWAATVSGRVFNDFNTDGVFNTDPNDGAVDVGVGGQTIRAFTGTNTLVDTATTAADGTYTLDLPAEKVRLELAVVRPWWPSRYAAGFDVRFIDASSPVTGVDFAVHQIHQYSFDNPDVFWPLQWAGPVLSTSENANEDAIRGLPFFRGDSESLTAAWADLAGRKVLATFGQIGTVFGLGIDQRNGDLYAGAYYKRFAGLKDRRTGAIYQITQSGDVSLFANLNAGPDEHPTSNDIDDWVHCAGNPPNPATCDTSWDFVGKLGLGSVVVDPGNNNLYTVNLFDKGLDRVPLNGSRRHARAAARVTSIPDPVPACVGGEWRPFAAGFNRTDGQLYVGGVCDAETSQKSADLRAIVYRVDNPTSAPTFTEVLNFPLDYPRAGTTSLQFCASPNFCAWKPWPTEASTGGLPPSSAGLGGGAFEGTNDDFPQLTSITFTADGRMTLGFRDLIGDMAGACVPGELAPGNDCTANTGFGPMSHGDLLTAGPGPGGTYTLEASGAVAGITSAGQSFNNWGYGPMGLDPGTAGYFYNPSPINGPGGTACPSLPRSAGSCTSGAPHPYQGGVAQVPGFADVVATSIHVLNPQANGLLWKDNSTGVNVRSLENFRTPDSATPQTPALSGFAKSNGLGDLDAYMGLAPLQIGNRLWYDENDNGIQDADEPPVTDTIVELVDCHGNVVGETKTDQNGEYVFDISPGTCYRVRVPLDQPSLHGWEPTTRFAGNDRRLDSNGRDVDGRSVAFVVPRGPGQNDFTYDFGFRRIPPPPKPQPPKPEPPAPQPPPGPEPDTPGVVPPSGPLELVKHVLHHTGSTVEYQIIVRNAGPSDVTNVRVCDRLPAALDFVSASASGHRVTGREVCWHFASLASGEERVLHLTTRVRAGTLTGAGTVNCVDARGIGAPPVPNAPGPHVGPVRACAVVHAPIRPPPPAVTG